MKTLITILLFALALLVPAQSFASNSSYDTSNTTATASATSHLYLTILPAVETFQIGEETIQSPIGLTKTVTLALRANTAWAISYQPQAYGFENAPACTDSGTSGPSNGDAGVGNGIQFVTISCYQPRSWADAPGASLDITYSTTQSF